MSSTSLLAAAVLTLASFSAIAAPPTASCPAYISEDGNTHSLSDASVFDGPPSEMADLVPTDAGWDLTSYKSSPRPLYLVCKYQHSTTTRALEIPKGLAACTIGTQAGATRISCK